MNDHDQLNQFLSSQHYMVIAVTLDDGTPWATPVRIKKWSGKEFEWDSKVTTEHSKAIANKPNIAISIFTPEGEGMIQYGFYAKAKAELLSEENSMGRYRATVTESWINDASFVKRKVTL
jgi:uncharacterized protein YhbP (UPF0306 family)